jgi:hypothetical protein
LTLSAFARTLLFAFEILTTSIPEKACILPIKRYKHLVFLNARLRLRAVGQVLGWESYEIQMATGCAFKAYMFRG